MVRSIGAARTVRLIGAPFPGGRAVTFGKIDPRHAGDRGDGIHERQLFVFHQELENVAGLAAPAAMVFVDAFLVIDLEGLVFFGL